MQLISIMQLYKLLNEFYISNTRKIPTRTFRDIYSQYTCFPAGTKITEKKLGEKEIQKVQIGDWVLSRNLKTGKNEWKQVDKVYVRQADSLIQLTFSNGSQVKPTPDHPFWNVEKQDWVMASDLKLGDKVLNEHYQVLEIKHILEVPGKVTVYNLRVKDNHNYFAEEVLVHNGDYNERQGAAQSESGNGTITVLTGGVTLSVNEPQPAIQQNDSLYLNTLNQSLNDLIDITRNNSNLTEASRIVYVSQLQEAQAKAASYSAQQLQQYSNPVHQQIANTVLQIQNEQTKTAINSGILFNNARDNLAATQTTLQLAKQSIDGDSQLTQAEKDSKKAQLDSNIQKLTDASNLSAARDALGLVGAAAFASVLPEISAFATTLGYTAWQATTGYVSMMATLSQTPQGRELVAELFKRGMLNGLAEEFAALGNNAVLQGQFVDVLAKEGPAGAIAWLLPSGLAHGLFGEAQGYLVQAINTGKNLQLDDLTRAASQFNKLDGMLESGKVPVSSFEGTVNRYVHPSAKPGEEFTIFKGNEFVAGNKLQDHRYTMGGKMGDEGLYVALDQQTAFAEIGGIPNYRLASKEVKLDKVLDLTDPETLKVFGVDSKDLVQIRAKTPNAYETTQMLGNLAKKYGFDAIKAPSQPNLQNNGVNLIILKEI
jgi:hypothetical protein